MDVANIANPSTGDSPLYRRSASALTHFSSRLFSSTFLLFLTRSPHLGLLLNHLPCFFCPFQPLFFLLRFSRCRKLPSFPLLRLPCLFLCHVHRSGPSPSGPNPPPWPSWFPRLPQTRRDGRWAPAFIRRRCTDAFP